MYQDPSINIRIFRKRWSLILGCFFPVSILKNTYFYRTLPVAASTGKCWWGLTSPVSPLLLVIKKYIICFDGQLYEVAVHVDIETFM